MATVDIPFPKSSLPGQQPGEGQGRLINCYCEVDAGVPTWRASPGFSLFCDTTLSTPRGFLNNGGVLYAAFENDVVTITSNAVITALTGTVSGTNNITWARNNKSPTPDVVLCDGSNTYSVSSSAVTAFADADWPSMKCVANLDGYIIGLTGSGQFWATDLNDVTVNPLSFTQCQANPDGGTRLVAYGRQVYVFGDASCEIYSNVGTSPFPFTRSEVVSVGLLSQFAIAGFESGWDGPLIFVAADGTVRKMDGYTPTRVSTKDVERAIQSVVNKDTISASVYVVAGHPVFSLSSLTWTWEFNLVTGLWHERQSYGLDRWRGSQGVFFNGQWVVGDTQSGKLFYLAESSFAEDSAQIVMTLESGPVKQFPGRVYTSAAFFDWTTGQGSILGSKDKTDPSVTVQWSMDGGATWSNEVNVRSLGGEGQFVNQIRVNRIGISTHHGARFRLTTSSPVFRSFRGGRAMVQERSAA